MKVKEDTGQRGQRAKSLTYKFVGELFCSKQALGSDLRARQLGNNNDNNKDKRESLS